MMGENSMKKLKVYLSVVVLLVSLFGTNAPKIDAAGQKKICIDPGHQLKQNLGKEPIAPGSKTYKTKVSSGTSGVVTKKPEYKLNLEVALQLQDALKKKNYQVFMTRTKHDVNLSNIQRAKYCNAKKVDLTIRIHADGSTDKNVQGVSVLYPSGTSTRKVNESSKRAAKYMLQEIINTTNAKKGYKTGLVPRSDLTGFNWSETPVVLVEMGFMSNPTEDRNLSTKSYQQKLVKGMVNGIDQSFKKTK